MLDGLPPWTTNIVYIVIATISSIILYYVIKFIAYRSLKVIREGTKKYYRSLTAAKLFINTSKYFIVIAYIITVSLILGAKVSTVIQGLGFFSIALGFGAKSLVEDCIAGMFIFFEEQYDVGDTIKINDFKGEVVSLGFKSTTLRNWVGNIYIIGNGKIMHVINYSQSDSMAVVKIKVDLNTDLNYLEEIVTNQMTDVKSKFDLFIENPEFKGVTNIGAAGMEIMVTAFTKPMKNIEGERLLRRELIELFNKNQVLLSSPKVEFKGENSV